MGKDLQDQTSDSAADQKPAGSALLLKAKAGLQERQARSMSLAKALRLTTAKVADDLMNMAMAVIGARTQSVTAEALGELFTADHLLVLLDGPDRRRAAAVLDRGLVGGLLQQQTMGKVGPIDTGDTRAMTATDAAVCAPFLDALLARAALLPDDPEEKALLSGFQFGARVANARLMTMALEEARYEIVHLTLDVAGGVRQGTLMLCLPVVVTDTLPGGGGPGKTAPPRPPVLLDKSVLALNLDLNVALTSLKMPLGAVQRLAVGDVIDLGVSAFDQACVQTRDGRRLSRGVLGQINGVRALQLEQATNAPREPRRRAEDRADLNLPKVAGDGTGTRKAVEDLDEAEELHIDDVPTGNSPADWNGLPDMTDLPGFEDDDDLQRLEAG